MATSIAKVSRGERILNSMSARGELTQSGKDWFVACVDPFHDTQLKELQGWPDVETGPSVVRCIKQSFQITHPIGIPVDTPWDAHIVMWPFHSQAQFSTSTQRQNNNFNFTNAGFGNLGGIQCYTVGSNVALNILTANTAAISTLDPTYTQGAGRLVGIGFEVTDTTAVLNRQGTCFVWKHMEAAEEPSLYLGVANPAAPNVYHYPFTGTSLRYPPTGPSEAMLIPGTRQWAAEEGCYVVGSFHSIENKPVAASYVMPVISSDATDDYESPTTNATPIIFPYPGLNAGGVDANFWGMYCPALKIDPIHQSGAQFLGLAYSASLTLSTIHYYESFPGIPQQDILVLATPSAEFDPAVLNLYSHAIGSMPVGVKVAENGLGDWFAGVVQKASQFMAPLLAGSGNPYGIAAGVGVKYIGDTLGEYLTPPNAKSKKGQTVVRKAKVNGAPNNGNVNARNIQPQALPKKKKKPNGVPKPAKAINAGRKGKLINRGGRMVFVPNQ